MAREEIKSLGVLNKRPNTKRIMRFRRHTFSWLIESLVANQKSNYAGCELNMMETCILKDGRASIIVKTKKLNAQDKTGVLDVTTKNLPAIKFLQHMSGALQDRNNLIRKKRRETRKKIQATIKTFKQKRKAESPEPSSPAIKGEQKIEFWEQSKKEKRPSILKKTALAIQAEF